jgi:nucleotide-binding universal stress UspA family protein
MEREDYMKGFQNTLVPLDRSEYAEQAIAVAGAIGRRSGGSLRLVSVEEPLPALALASDSPDVAREVELEECDQLSHYLDSIADLGRNVQRGTVDTAILHGPPATALSEYAHSNGVDLVVMTTRGRRGLSRWLIGSVADQLLRRIHVPVLLLHPSELPQPTEFRHILIALDGEIEAPVLDPAAALGSLYPGAHYTLVRVVEPSLPIVTPLAPYPMSLGPERTTGLVVEASNYLEKIRGQLRARGLEATSKVVVGFGVATQVLQLGEALGADCIVVGTHSRRRVERLVLGSEASRIVRGAAVPVLIGPVQGR